MTFFEVAFYLAWIALFVMVFVVQVRDWKKRRAEKKRSKEK